MKELRLTAKIQIILTGEERALLDKTMIAYRDACNFVSEYIFESHDIKLPSVHKSLYYVVRDQFGLKSQMTQSVFRTVVNQYKTIDTNTHRWIKPIFKKPCYDLIWNRDYKLTADYFSIQTIKGRIKVPYYSKAMEKYFDNKIYKFGTARLICKNNKYFLHIPVCICVEDIKPSDTCNIVGIDRGMNFIITTYDSNRKTGFVNGRAIKHKRMHYQKLRTELQMKGTPSARRRLKTIGNRENRWMQNVNHCVSKTLVESNPEHTLFVLEDLTGIRKVTENVSRENRQLGVSWSFFDLEQKIIYKSQQHKSLVIKVNPCYTSQRCPICGYVDKHNRDKTLHLFTCKKCGYKSNDDRIGAMNLHNDGITYLKQCAVAEK